MKGIYIQLFSVHGLVRGEAPELGRDADTGGQVKYVLELARALACQPEVAQVDLFTRLIEDKRLSPSYARPIEPLNDKARLIRLPCGGRKYIRKELLWPHLDEFVDRTVRFIRNEGRIPDFFHGHYADGGYVAQELARIFGMPFIFTGHSMGLHKKNRLLSEGAKEQELQRKYQIDYRIEVEEKIIENAELIITSTNHELKNQYGLYRNHESGRYAVIPPGIDVDIFYPYYDNEIDPNHSDEVSKQAHMTLINELQRFWVGPQKPFVLALCRPDQRKNISGLITAYGEDLELQAMANLAIFAGIRKNITEMEENEQNVLTEMLLLMDQYDLYGKMAIPKKHNFSLEVPELYRLCASGGGVFVNPALIEPFGLTLIEAASCGVPIVATNDGGPADIIGNCDNGFLVDPTDSSAIAVACKNIITDHDLWNKFSRNGINGIRSHYSWSSHCAKMLKEITEVKDKMPLVTHRRAHTKVSGIGRRLTRVNRLLVTDIDNTLVGDDEAMKKLLAVLDDSRQIMAWGVATGRCREMMCDILEEYGVPLPDIMITSVGTEIYYGALMEEDRGWQRHLSYRWRPEAVMEVMAGLDFVELQEEDARRRYKLSYYMEDDPEMLAEVHRRLHEARLRSHVVYSHGQFLDILPLRASKGKAVRYLSNKWGIPLTNIMVCGDSGNDLEMLRGETCGVVVGNYSKELEPLKGLRKLYFSKQEYAAGIIDGIAHYGFIK